MIKSGESSPEIFSDPLFLRSSNWVLSTSAIYNPRFRVYGWGEVVPEGFGVAYVAGFDSMLILVIFASVTYFFLHRFLAVHRYITDRVA